MKQRSFYATLIFSNLILLFVAFIVALVGFRGYIRFSSEQSDEYSEVILRQIRSTFDDKMSSINKLILDISYNTEVSSLSFTKDAIDEQSRYHSVQVMKTLSNYVSVYNFLDSICLYYPDSDRVISHTAAYSSSEQFLNNADCAYWPGEEWDRLFQSEYYREYRMTDDIFTIISPLVFTDDTYILINVKASFIQEMFENMRTVSQSLTCVKEEQTGRILFSIGDISLVSYLDVPEGNFQNENGVDYTVTSLESKENDWVYYFLLPENPFIEDAFDLLTVSSVVLLLIGGTVICFILARQNAMPIRLLAKRVSDQMQVDSTSKNEVEVITQASTQAIDQYQSLKKLIDRYQPVLRSRLLQQLFQGIITPDAITPQDQNTVGIQFPYPHFCIALLSLQQDSSQGQPLSCMAEPQIMEYINCLPRENSVVFCAELGLNRIGILINSQASNQEGVRANLRNILEYAYKEFGIQITAVAADCNDGEDRLDQIYIQCVRALEKQLIRYPGEIIFAKQDNQEVDIYYYPVEVEMKLLESVKVGNLKNVNAILDSVILENFVDNTLNLESSRCLFFNLMGTAFKVIGAFGYRMDDILEDGGDCYQRILNCQNIQDMEALMREIFYNICLYINQNHHTETPLITRLTEHIRANSDDPNLSLISVASAFGINPNYLSGYFKEQTGENFLAFVHKIRLEHAKELLKDTSMPLNAIALKVGYSGDAVFIRNFKKYMGCTPGQYRGQAQSDSQDSN